jgi:hypothetical protein
VNPRLTNRLGAASAIAGILVMTAVAVPAAQRRRADNSTIGAPVATNTIATSPDRYLGKLVTVSAAVDQVLSKTAFVVDQRKAVGAKEVKAVGTPLLVIAPNMMGAVEPNRYFLVRGEILKLSTEALAKAAAGYTLDVAPDVLAKYQGQPVMVANSVLDAKYAELVKAPAPPAAAAKAPAAAN